MVPISDIAYRIDSDDRITTVSGGWTSFALDNGGELLVPPGILGASLWSSITDVPTREMYRSLLRRVRTGALTARFHFRCDSPGLRRLLEMQVTATEDGDVDFRTELIRSQPRTEVALMDPATDRSDAILTMCGWCMRIPVAGTWVEVEEAIAALGLFVASPMPGLTHGMCPACFDTMQQALEDPTLLASGDVIVGPLP